MKYNSIITSTLFQTLLIWLIRTDVIYKKMLFIVFAIIFNVLNFVAIEDFKDKNSKYILVTNVMYNLYIIVSLIENVSIMLTSLFTLMLILNIILLIKSNKLKNKSCKKNYKKHNSITFNNYELDKNTIDEVARTKVENLSEKIEDLTHNEVYIASNTGKKIHTPSCIVAARIPENKRILFDNKIEAIKKGYSFCGVCCPNE